MIKEPSSESGRGKTLEANPHPVHRLATEHLQPRGMLTTMMGHRPAPLAALSFLEGHCHGCVHMHILGPVKGTFNKANSFLLALFCYKEKNMSRVLYAQICPSLKELIFFLIPSRAPGL